MAGRVSSVLWHQGHNTHLAFLQETHLSDFEHLKLRRDWVGQVFHSSFNSKNRGVAILLHKRLPFTLEKCIKDSEGRYVIISGYLYGEKLTLGCIYSPQYIWDLFLFQIASRLILWYFTPCNLGWGPKLLFRTRVGLKPPQIYASIQNGSSHQGALQWSEFICTWRILNPKVKDFTFFSCPNNSLSRIDYFFTSRRALDRVRTYSIKAMMLSDHSLIRLELTPPYYDPSVCHWQLNPSLLSNPTFFTLLEEQLTLFFSINDTPDVSASTLWEAYIRGVTISYTSAKRNQALRQQLELECQISDLEKEFKHSLSKSVLLKLDAARSALDSLLTQKAETAIFYQAPTIQIC